MNSYSLKNYIGYNLIFNYCYEPRTIGYERKIYMDTIL